MLKKGRDERQREVLELLAEVAQDGANPNLLAEKLGIEPLYAAVLLSRLRKQGIVLKKKAPDGCRYCLSSKGERKLRWLEVKV